MEVALELEGVLGAETLEGLIPPHLVRCRHLVSANWSNLAVSLNGMDHIINPINLSQLLGRHLNLLWLADIALLLLLGSFLLFLVFLYWLLIAIAVIPFLLDEFALRHALEEGGVAVDELFVLVIEPRHLFEGVIVGEAEEELLLWELKHFLEGNAHGNEVVVGKACRIKRMG